MRRGTADVLGTRNFSIDVNKFVEVEQRAGEFSSVVIFQERVTGVPLRLGGRALQRFLKESVSGLRARGEGLGGFCGESAVEKG